MVTIDNLNSEDRVIIDEVNDALEAVLWEGNIGKFLLEKGIEDEKFIKTLKEYNNYLHEEGEEYVQVKMVNFHEGQKKRIERTADGQYHERNE